MYVHYIMSCVSHYCTLLSNVHISISMKYNSFILKRNRIIQLINQWVLIYVYIYVHIYQLLSAIVWFAKRWCYQKQEKYLIIIEMYIWYYYYTFVDGQKNTQILQSTTLSTVKYLWYFKIKN